MSIQSPVPAFISRHIGTRNSSDVATMLKYVGYDSIDGLVDSAVPKPIGQEKPLKLKVARTLRTSNSAT
jgi:glycine dehydrogenase